MGFTGICDGHCIYFSNKNCEHVQFHIAHLFHAEIDEGGKAQITFLED